MLKRIIALILSFGLMLSFVSFAEETAGNPYKNEVAFIESIGLLPDGFSADAPMSRSAFAKMITDMFYSYLSQQYFDVKLYEDILPTFERDSFDLTFDFVAQLSLLKIIKAFLKAKLMLNREVKNAER